MKKFIVPVVAVIIGIIIPIAGMTISPTRDMILGLAPDEAVLQLADKIDENRVSSDAKLAESDQKIAELQSTVESQQAELTEQQQMIDNQSSQISSVKNESQTTQAKVNNEAECRNLYSANPECTISNKIYRTKSDFDNFIEKMEKFENTAIEACKKMPGTSSKECESENKIDFDKYSAKFKKCQEIIAQCG